MNEPQTPVRSVSARVVLLVGAFGVDLIGLVAVVLIGVSVYRLAPQFVWGYCGLVLLAIWASVARDRAMAIAVAAKDSRR